MRLARGTASEARSNLGARLGLTIALVSIVSAGTFGVFVTELRSTADALVYSDFLRDNGFDTYLVKPSDANNAEPLTDDICRSLRPVPGVKAVAWAKGPLPAHLHSQAGPFVNVLLIDGDFHKMARFLNPGASPTLESTAALLDTSYRAVPFRPDGSTGFRLTTAAGVYSIAAQSMQLGGLGRLAASSLVASTTIRGPIDACFLAVARDDRQIVVNTVDAAAPSLRGYSRQWILANAEKFELPERRFDARISHWYWLAATLIMTLPWLFYLRLRRPDFAVYAIGGATYLRLVALACAEGLMVVIPGTAITAAAMVATVRWQGTAGQIVRVGATSAARTALATLIIWPLLATLGVRGRARTLDVLKER
jgi:hypothetical protein